MKLIPTTLGLLLFSCFPIPAAAKPSGEASTPPAKLSAGDWADISTVHDAWKHSIQTSAGGHAARNRSQQWHLHFDQRGFLVTPDAGDWQWGLELESYGYAGHTQVLVETVPAAAQTEGSRLTRIWDAILQEWYVNDRRGLEHGFTLATNPPGVENGRPLELQLIVRGGLTPRVSAGGLATDFINDQGATVLTYSELKVWDADARRIQARMKSAGDARLAIEIDDRGARYPLTVDPLAQQAYLKAGNNGPVAMDRFGAVVAMDGNTIVIGAPDEPGDGTGVNPPPDRLGGNRGAAFVFVRNGAVWSQQAYLKSPRRSEDGSFGISVAISGDTVVVGHYNERGSGTGVNPAYDSDAPFAGAAYVFVRDGTAWSQQAYLKASNTGEWDRFGSSLAIAGDTVVVGSPYEDGGGIGINPPSSEDASNSGAAYVFVRSGSAWSQQAYLKASNTGADDNFGASVTAVGDTIVAGAPSEDGDGTGVNPPPNNSNSGSGAAYVFIRSAGAWSQQAYLKAAHVTSDSDIYADFGTAVAMSAETLVVGATGGGCFCGPVIDPRMLVGIAYVFVRQGATWGPQASLKGANTGANDRLGVSVAISGDTAVLGANGEAGSGSGVNPADNETAPYAGAAYVFTRAGTAWSQQAHLKASNTGAGDAFGSSVAVSGDLVMIGSPGEDGSGRSVNPAADDKSREAGAVYAFVRHETEWSQEAYLKPPNTALNPGFYEQFGQAVAISGDTVAVGAPNEAGSGAGVNPDSDEMLSGSGAVYVFVRQGTGWSQEAYLKASNPGEYDHFGSSVAVAGDIIVVGVGGDDGGGTGLNPASNDDAAESGAAYIFKRSGGAWIQEAYVKASDARAADTFGTSVAVSGETVVVGSPGYDGYPSWVNAQNPYGSSNSGAAYVFKRSGGTWSQQALLKPANGYSEFAFGSSVAVSGNSIIVGSPREYYNGAGVNPPAPGPARHESGAAYVFVEDQSGWTEQVYLKATNPSAFDHFGASVAMDGDRVVIGAPHEQGSGMGVNPPDNNAFQRAGAAYIFSRTGTTWTADAYLKASNTGADDTFGTSVAISGATVVVGAPGEDGSGTGINPATDENAAQAGAAYLFVLNAGNWTPLAYFKGANGGKEDLLGYSVAVSGGTVIAGAMGENSSSSGVNVEGPDDANSSGAAYIFNVLPPLALQVTGNGSVITDDVNTPSLDDHTDFGPATVAGGTSERTFTITNSGTGTIDLGEVTVGGIHNAEFTVTLQPPASVAANSSTEFKIVFDPAAAGLRAATLSFATNVPGANPFNFIIQGTGTVPEMTVRAGNLEIPNGDTTPSLADFTDFDSRLVAGGKSVRTFTIQNAGTAVLMVGSVAVGGTHATEFAVTSPPPASVGAGSSATFQVTFDPEDTGMRTATLSIASNDTDENPFQFSIQGTGRVTPNGIELWRQTHFSTMTETGEANDSADPDNDGELNFIEFATGQNPRQATSVITKLSIIRPFLEFEYTRSVAAVNDGYTIAPQWSNLTLQGKDTWISGGFTSEALSDDGVVQRIKARIRTPSFGRAQQFVRIKVSH